MEVMVMHQKYNNKAKVGAAGSDHIHPHRMPKICPGRIPPHSRCPIRKIYDNGYHTGCKNQKFFYFQGKLEYHEQLGKSHAIHNGGETESAPVPQNGTQGAHAIPGVGLMLIDLG